MSSYVPNKYRFIEKTPAATVQQHWRKDEKITSQSWNERTGGIASAIAYAQSHGKRQDLGDYVYLTEVIVNGEVVYSVQAWQNEEFTNWLEEG